MEHFFFVYAEAPSDLNNQTGKIMNPLTKRHSTYDSAFQEAKRIAGLPASNGGKVFILSPLGYSQVTAPPVAWNPMMKG